MIYTEQLYVGYGKRIVLSGINLNIDKGQIVTLIGPNGSGKSTVLKTITKQLSSISGSISICESQNKDVRNIEQMTELEVARHMSMVMTERIRTELMTCRDVVATGRYPYTGRLGILSELDQEKIDEAMNLVNASKIGDKPFEGISDGQRQRVMLARAICQDTDIIVLDEPTSYLDMKYKLEILKLIVKLSHEKGKAIIMSLHELDLARAVSDYIVCVDGSKVVKSGTPDEVYNGDFLQKLFGVDNDEFDPATGHMFLKIR